MILSTVGTVGGVQNGGACFFLEKRLAQIKQGFAARADSARASRDPIGESVVMRYFAGFMAAAMILPGMIARSWADSPGSVNQTKEANAILATHCVHCHGPDKKKGGLDLSRRASALAGGETGVAIVPGSPDESLLVYKVTDGEMPPQAKLGQKQIQAVRDWVENGASYLTEPISPRRAAADWWSLRPICPVVPPCDHAQSGLKESRDARDSIAADWIKTPIDAFIAAELRASGLTPAPPADPATLIRRVTFDLTGLPPSPDDVDAFVEASARRPARL